MFGGISAALLFDYMKRSGWMEQTSFDFPPVIYIRNELVRDVQIGHSFNDTGWHGTKDHPAFTSLRDDLEKRGYISVERGWRNGDIVLKPFYLNQVYFDEGETFPCAAAIRYNLRSGKYINSAAWYAKEADDSDEYKNRCSHTMEMSF